MRRGMEVVMLSSEVECKSYTEMILYITPVYLYISTLLSEAKVLQSYQE